MKENLNSSKPSNHLGILYVCATPIGNLSDVSLRFLDVMESVTLIATEDTRSTAVLLKQYELEKRCVSLEKHNEADRIQMIWRHLSQGEDLALLSEAGTPAISDPGSYLVSKIREKGGTIVPIPGASAVTTFLSASGLSADRFVFLGFLPRKESERIQVFSKYSDELLVFFESPKRIQSTLEWISQTYEVTDAIVAKELSKIHEHFWVDIPSVLKEFEKDPRRLKGEWIVGIQIASMSTTEDKTWIRQFRDKGFSSQHVLEIAKTFTNLTRNEVYKDYHD